MCGLQMNSCINCLHLVMSLFELTIKTACWRQQGLDFVVCNYEILSGLLNFTYENALNRAGR